MPTKSNAELKYQYIHDGAACPAIWKYTWMMYEAAVIKVATKMILIADRWLLGARTAAAVNTAIE